MKKYYEYFLNHMIVRMEEHAGQPPLEYVLISSNISINFKFSGLNVRKEMIKMLRVNFSANAVFLQTFVSGEPLNSSLISERVFICEVFSVFIYKSRYL